MSHGSVDVIIVGAGLSGLTCAVELAQGGKKVIVLEAMDRVGGKIQSVQASYMGGKVDLGAAWFNDTTQSEVYALAKKSKLNLIPQYSEGQSIFQDSTNQTSTYSATGFPPIGSAAEMIILEEFLGKLSNLIDSVNVETPMLSPNADYLDSLTIEEYILKEAPVEARNISMKAVKFLIGPILGAEAAEMSLLFFLVYSKSGTGIFSLSSDLKDGAQYLRSRQGNQQLCEYLRAQLPAKAVILSSPVKEIIQNSNGFNTVETTGGLLYMAQKVVVTIPTTLYSTIAFSPSLPTSKQTLAESTALGYWAKIIFIFEKPWWRDAGLSGAFISEIGPATSSRDTSADDGEQYSISTFIVGDLGRNWSKFSKAERLRQSLKQFCTVFEAALRKEGSSYKIPDPINVLEKEWSKQAFIMGAPSPYVLPGVLTSDVGKSLRTPVGDIHFAGTQFSTVWQGYMDGAIRSGRETAAAVLEELKN